MPVKGQALPSATQQAPLALTMGEPAGIGPEIALRAWLARAHQALPAFAFYGDPGILEARARAFGLDVPIATIEDIAAAAGIFPSALPVMPVPLAVESVAGQPNRQNAPATIASIERAVADCVAGRAHAVVTCPIAKHVLYSAGFDYPGHTEFLAALAGRHFPSGRWNAVMMLASDQLRVVPLTIHVPLKDVPGLISTNLIIDAAQIVWQALCHQFAIDAPRIAVAGLNPHAGERGTIGKEDAEIITPAIETLRAQGLTVSGPHAADTLFHEKARATYDVVLCMYHDQALIPIKTLAFDEGVNVTLGLPFVRTSPDHGTAFDIAPKGVANASSLIEALKLAGRMGRVPREG